MRPKMEVLVTFQEVRLPSIVKVLPLRILTVLQLMEVGSTSMLTLDDAEQSGLLACN